MTMTKKIKVANAIGTQLDWLVAKAIGEYRPITVPSYSTDWAQGGAIIEREKITTSAPFLRTDWIAYFSDGMSDVMNGPTPLITAMRCYVGSKLGDEVEVPDELV